MRHQRGSGILLHITSLPSNGPIGDLGEAAYEFVELLAAAGQRYWQVLPLGQTGYGNSPYSCYSAFAGNIYLISPEKLSIPADDEPAEASGDRVNFGKAIEAKTRLLRNGFERFRHEASDELAAGFHRFCDENAFWLEDYSLYRAIATERRAPWQEWDEALRRRDAAALLEERQKLDEAAFAEKYYQFEFFRQWQLLKSHANENGIKIIGDVPIYVTADSCDVWCNQEIFRLDGEGRPAVLSGVPPDAFSDDGQLWGTPVYDWPALRDRNFGWWVARIAANLRLFDILRVDHFIGLTRAWAVPSGEETARNGKWETVPGRELFDAVRGSLGNVPLIAEDLGVLTPEVEELRDSLRIPGMRVLQFAFGGDAGNPHLPHNFTPNSVAYTGTHDSDTSVGWFRERKKRRRGKGADPAAAHCLRYIRSKGAEINWDMITLAMASVADIAIVPMQDVLGLGNSARMNLPATKDGNWEWRMREMPPDETLERLARLSELYGRR